jgi:hypothetical protein
MNDTDKSNYLKMIESANASVDEVGELKQISPESVPNIFQRRKSSLANKGDMPLDLFRAIKKMQSNPNLNDV